MTIQALPKGEKPRRAETPDMQSGAIWSAILDGDIVLGRTSGDYVGVAIPAAMLDLPDDRLRFDGTSIIDVGTTARDYWIDGYGRRHITEAADRQLLACNIEDRLVPGLNGWTVETAAARIAAARAQARRKVITYADSITARITGRYPAAEVASWPTREAEARAVVAGAKADNAPLLALQAEADGTTLLETAQSVLVKATQYRAIVIAVTMMREQADAALATTSSPEEIAAALANLRLAAEAKATKLGVG